MLSRIELAAIAASLGLGAAMVFATPSPMGSFLSAAFLLVAMSGWIAVVDRRDFLIPDGPVIAIGLLGAAARLGGGDRMGGPALEALLIGLDAILWGGGFFLVREIYFRRRGFDGLGLGDVKLAATGAALNGTAGFAWALLAASSAALLVAGLTGATGAMRRRRIAFGAFLAPACCGIWLAQAAGWLGR